MGNRVTVLAKVTVKKDKVQAKLQELSIVSVAKARKENMPSKTTPSKSFTPIENTKTSETGSNITMEESVIVEGLGKTEASAKKDAYKEAVAKVVGVLIDSSTLVKNDKIIDEELLEYSGGFVKNADVLSTKTDDEGLVRVKVKCLIEKAQVKRKLEDMKVLVIKVDGASLAAREMTQEDMRKNAATLVNKALEERKKIYEVKMPKKLEELEKQENGCVYLPVSVEFNEAKFKAWVDNWVPVFDKLALEKTSGVINYRTLKASGKGQYEVNNERFLQGLLIKSKAVSRNQSFYLMVALNTLKEGPVQFNAYKIPCGTPEITPINRFKIDPNTRQYKFYKGDNLTINTSIKTKANELIYSQECDFFSVIRGKRGYYKNPDRDFYAENEFHGRVSIAEKNINMSGNLRGLLGLGQVADSDSDGHAIAALVITPPIPGHFFREGESTRLFTPGNFGCFFEIDISKIRLNSIDKIETLIDWKQSNITLEW
jgi:hypothetical protein